MVCGVKREKQKMYGWKTLQGHVIAYQGQMKKVGKVNVYVEHWTGA